MDSKTTLSIMAVAIIVFGLVAASTFASPDDASAQKSCAAKKWSHCERRSSLVYKTRTSPLL